MYLSVVHTTVILNGQEQTGFSEDEDAITMPDEEELFTVQRGALGDIAAFRNGMRGGQVKLKYLPTSESARLLSVLYERLRSGEALVRFDGTVKDDLNGQSFTLRKGVMVSGPMGQTMGKGSVKPRIFTFEFEDIEQHWDGVSFEFAAGEVRAIN